jgi:hypothetical protein
MFDLVVEEDRAKIEGVFVNYGIGGVDVLLQNYFGDFVFEQLATANRFCGEFYGEVSTLFDDVWQRDVRDGVEVVAS